MTWRYADLLRHLEDLSEQRITPGLERMQQAVVRMGNPQSCAPIVHIAGTNGKGSTAMLLASLLEVPGQRVGLCTSPHLLDFAERIRINRQPADHHRLATLGELLARNCVDLQLSYFEFATMLGWLCCQQVGVHLLIQEVGLGGRLDATNVLSPELVLLTPISIDHAEWLGSDLSAIAREKCGIIKPGVRVVSAPQEPAVRAVIEAACTEQGAELSVVDPVAIEFDGLVGAHQQVNVAVAEKAAQLLHARGYSRRTLHELEPIVWSGRCEWLAENLLFDVAHNPAAARVLARYLQSIKADRQVHCIFSCFSSKDVRGIIRALRPAVEELLLPYASDARACTPEQLAEDAAYCDVPARIVHWNDIDVMLQANDPTSVFVATGSCTHYANLRNLIL